MPDVLRIHENRSIQPQTEIQRRLLNQLVSTKFRDVYKTLVNYIQSVKEDKPLTPDEIATIQFFLQIVGNKMGFKTEVQVGIPPKVTYIKHLSPQERQIMISRLYGDQRFNVEISKYTLANGKGLLTTNTVVAAQIQDNKGSTIVPYYTGVPEGLSFSQPTMSFDVVIPEYLQYIPFPINASDDHEFYARAMQKGYGLFVPEILLTESKQVGDEIITMDMLYNNLQYRYPEFHNSEISLDQKFQHFLNAQQNQ